MKEKEEYLVVIPYLAQAAQGTELEFAIAGWRKHFKEPFHIVVIGEGLPTITGGDVDFIDWMRVPAIAGQYRQHLDYVNCFKEVHRRFPYTDGFIFVADDCYAVNDFDIHDVKFLKMLEPEFNCEQDTPNQWRQDKLKTKRVLKVGGWPVRNFTTHLPIWFEWDKIEELWETYDMAHNSLVVEDLYFNIYYPNRVPFKLNSATDNLKLGIYTTRPDEAEIQRAFEEKIWITNSPDGWQPALWERLEEYYGLP